MQSLVYQSAITVLYKFEYRQMINKVIGHNKGSKNYRWRRGG